MHGTMNIKLLYVCKGCHFQQRTFPRRFESTTTLTHRSNTIHSTTLLSHWQFCAEVFIRVFLTRVSKYSYATRFKCCLLLSLYRELWNLYIVHSPTNPLFIKHRKLQIYIKIHIIIAPACFGLRPSSGSLYRAWLKLHFC